MPNPKQTRASMRATAGPKGARQGRRLSFARSFANARRTVPQTPHSMHGEAPKQFAELLIEFEAKLKT